MHEGGHGGRRNHSKRGRTLIVSSTRKLAFGLSQALLTWWSSIRDKVLQGLAVSWLLLMNCEFIVFIQTSNTTLCKIGCVWHNHLIDQNNLSSYHVITTTRLFLELVQNWLMGKSLLLLFSGNWLFWDRRPSREPNPFIHNTVNEV